MRKIPQQKAESRSLELRANRSQNRSGGKSRPFARDDSNCERRLPRGGGFGSHRREILRLRVPALRAKPKARDTSLRMTAQCTRPLSAGGWLTSRQACLPGTACRAPTRQSHTDGQGPRRAATDSTSMDFDGGLGGLGVGGGVGGGEGVGGGFGGRDADTALVGRPYAHVRGRIKSDAFGVGYAVTERS